MSSINYFAVMKYLCKYNDKTTWQRSAKKCESNFSPKLRTSEVIVRFFRFPAQFPPGQCLTLLLTNDVNINTDMGENFQQKMGCLQQHFTGPSVTCFGYLRGSAFTASLPLTGPPFVGSCIFTIKWPPCRRNLKDARYKEFRELKILRNVIPVNFQLYRGPYSTSAMFSRFRLKLITCRTRIFIQEKNEISAVRICIVYKKNYDTRFLR